MDVGTIRGIGTLLLLLVFVGYWAWAWAPAQRRRFEEAALLPFLGEEDELEQPRAAQAAGGGSPAAAGRDAR